MIIYVIEFLMAKFPCSLRQYPNYSLFAKNLVVHLYFNYDITKHTILVKSVVEENEPFKTGKIIIVTRR